ncbi:aminoglycoside phosphotransferase family protein [Leifsonia sp. YIM 134122]|uniref:Aminoglycoside phosphotransferase family protein n=1 Tax=Leifsonia stereocauli TaxID=3134136 RepID=A0ABU9VZS9_9MICO
MHSDELPVDAGLVRRLLSEQFPAWATLPVSPLATGTVNAMFRLGDEMVVRLPFVERAAGDILFEQRWLPVLGPALPVRIPRVLATGSPSAEYPCPWLVLDWLPGTPPVPGAAGTDADEALADDIVAFLAGLRRIDTADAPPGYRSGTFHGLAPSVRASIDAIADLVDAPSLRRLWDDSLAAAPWTGEPVWTHGDLLSGNLLVEDDRLSGVLDIACAGVGDPACDLLAAWSILQPRARARLRALLGVDDETWRRGRGWAVAQASIALAYYRDTFPQMANTSLHMLREVAASL